MPVSKNRTKSKWLHMISVCSLFTQCTMSVLNIAAMDEKGGVGETVEDAICRLILLR